eukprot:TRINITY_DN1733_c1_g1_i3.p1 TRINITY_DN1733_c1_g1~~TRINITY_DN1733_c1_g1_i3.p1  ORF type:complete len:485 (+),score=18.41 TRINITY_DN1733_c1_g1_i3:99-1457(+)
MAHFLVVTYPLQGHINPALQLAKHLVRLGTHVTFSTTLAAHRRMLKSLTTLDGLTYAPFSDGYDDGLPDDPSHYMAQFKQLGHQYVCDLIPSLANVGRPITCVIYTILLSWAADVARGLNIPSALFWIQPATVFSIYYYYFHGYITDEKNGPSSLIELPGLPLLTVDDLPAVSVFKDTTAYASIFESLRVLFETLDKEAKPVVVLVNTFDALEDQALTSVDGMKMIGIGPMVPSAFLDGKDPSETSFGSDLYNATKSYMEWLDSKPSSSVVYLSFGSISVLSKHQMEEILLGLKETNRPFLWVIKETENGTETDISDSDGLVVPWCSQVEVLSHPSVGCFVTHCGWNSTIESLVIGVPVVGFPQWTDQPTNVMLMEGFCKKGVRARVNKEGVLEGDELKRCLDLVMGDGRRSKEIGENCLKWRDLAREAVSDGGTSDRNIREFVAEVSAGRL